MSSEVDYISSKIDVFSKFRVEVPICENNHRVQYMQTFLLDSAFLYPFPIAYMTLLLS